MLSDPEKRAAYDRYGVAGVNGAAGGGGFPGGVDLGDIFGDLFGEMFNVAGGRSGRASRAQRGRDMRYDLTIEFEEAIFGKETTISIKRMDICADCRGSGAAHGKVRQHLPAVRRARPGALPAGILLDCAHVPICGGTGPGGHRAVPDLPR